MVKTLPSSTGGAGSIPDGGAGEGVVAKTPHTSRTKNNKTLKQKQYCNKLDKDFKNGPDQKREREREVRSCPGPAYQLTCSRKQAEEGPVLASRVPASLPSPRLPE